MILAALDSAGGVLSTDMAKLGPTSSARPCVPLVACANAVRCVSVSVSPRASFLAKYAMSASSLFDVILPPGHAMRRRLTSTGISSTSQGSRPSVRFSLMPARFATADIWFWQPCLVAFVGRFDRFFLPPP